MPLRTVFLALGTAMLSCAHGPSKWALPQDPSVRCPNFYADVPTRLSADGGIFEFDDLLIQALQVATHDFFDDLPGCAAGRPLTKYRTIRQGDIVFIKIEGEPEKCGASYAIDDTGKILHRHLGSGVFSVDEDGGEEEGAPDGGQPASPPVLGAVDDSAPRVALPWDVERDAGTSPDAESTADAGMDAGAGANPDAGTRH